MTEGGARQLSLDVPATHAAGRMARRVAHEYLASTGLEGVELEQAVFVLGELLDNAIDHGGGGAARDSSEVEEPARVHLEVESAGGAWRVAVEDEGDGDPAVLEAMLGGEGAMPDLDDPRGRGLLLLQAFVDRVRVTAATSGRGVRIEVARERGEG